MKDTQQKPSEHQHPLIKGGFGVSENDIIYQTVKHNLEADEEFEDFDVDWLNEDDEDDENVSI